jgi:hypothetical protein
METKRCNEDKEDWCRLLNLSGVDENVGFTRNMYDNAPKGGTYVQIGDEWIERLDERIASLPFAQLTCLPAYLLDQKELLLEHIPQLNFDPAAYKRFAILRRKFLNMDGRYDTASDALIDVQSMGRAIVDKTTSKTTTAFYRSKLGLSDLEELYGCDVTKGDYTVYRIRRGEVVYICTKGDTSADQHGKIQVKLRQRHETMFDTDECTCSSPYRNGLPLAKPMTSANIYIHAIWYLLLLLNEYDDTLSFQYMMLYEKDAVLTQAVKYLNHTYLK